MTQSELDERHERGVVLGCFMAFFVATLLAMFATIAYRLGGVERKLKELEAAQASQWVK